jgi:hypothetical protein
MKQRMHASACTGGRVFPAQQKATANAFSRRAFRSAMTPLFDIVNIHLKRDPEKCAAVFREDHA